MNKINQEWAEAMAELVPYYFVDGKFELLEGNVYPTIKNDKGYHWVQVAADGQIVKVFTREEIVWR